MVQRGRQVVRKGPAALRIEFKRGKAAPMAEDWERQAVLQEITERITEGEFAGEFDDLKAALDETPLLNERDRQQLLQYWVSKEREGGGS